MQRLANVADRFLRTGMAVEKISARGKVEHRKREQHCGVTLDPTTQTGNLLFHPAFRVHVPGHDWNLQSPAGLPLELRQRARSLTRQLSSPKLRLTKHMAVKRR